MLIENVQGEVVLLEIGDDVVEDSQVMVVAKLFLDFFFEEVSQLGRGVRGGRYEITEFNSKEENKCEDFP